MNDVPWLLYAATAIGLYFGILQPAVKSLRKRISPKYAAKCLVAERKRDDNRLNKWRSRQERQNRAMLAWAEAHPSDPTAKAFLAAHNAHAHAAPETDAVVDPGASLRYHLQIQDDTAARVAELRRQQAEWLQWSLDNPAEPDAQRLLNERLKEARTTRDRLNSRIESRTALAQFNDTAAQDDPELLELESERTAVNNLIERIEQALEFATHTE